jgi:hypothetical protein
MTGRPRPLLVAGVVAAGLLALRAAAPFVAPPPAEPPPAPAVAVAATRPQPLAEATGASLFLNADDGLLRVDLDRGRVRRVPLPGGATAGDNGLVERDGVVVAVRGGIAYRTGGPAGLAATPLGPASYAFASARPGRVWLVEETGDPARWFRVREIALGPAPAGPGPAPARALPLERRPVAATPGGLLVNLVGPGGGLATWDPRTGRLERRLAADTPLAAVAASGPAVAWVEGSALHLGDLASGRARVVAPPPGTDGFAAAGAFSPDGRTLAAVTQAGFSTRPALALVAVDRAGATRVAGSEGALSDRCSPCVAWAPDGDWVFFGRLGPGFAVGAYRLGRPQAVTVPVDVPGAFPPSLVSSGR